MTETTTISIEVVYATPEKQELIKLQMPLSATARSAALASALDVQFPGLQLENCPLGIFGKQVDDAHMLRSGDRVEIYRPLINEPRDARRALAARGQTMGTNKQREGNGDLPTA